MGKQYDLVDKIRNSRGQGEEEEDLVSKIQKKREEEDAYERWKEAQNKVLNKASVISQRRGAVNVWDGQQLTQDQQDRADSLGNLWTREQRNEYWQAAEDKAMRNRNAIGLVDPEIANVYVRMAEEGARIGDPELLERAQAGYKNITNASRRQWDEETRRRQGTAYQPGQLAPTVTGNPDEAMKTANRASENLDYYYRMAEYASRMGMEPLYNEAVKKIEELSSGLDTDMSRFIQQNQSIDANQNYSKNAPGYYDYASKMASLSMLYGTPEQAYQSMQELDNAADRYETERPGDWYAMTMSKEDMEAGISEYEQRKKNLDESYKPLSERQNVIANLDPEHYEDGRPVTSEQELRNLAKRRDQEIQRLADEIEKNRAEYDEADTMIERYKYAIDAQQKQGDSVAVAQKLSEIEGRTDYRTLVEKGKKEFDAANQEAFEKTNEEKTGLLRWLESAEYANFETSGGTGSWETSLPNSYASHAIDELNGYNDVMEMLDAALLTPAERDRFYALWGIDQDLAMKYITNAKKIASARHWAEVSAWSGKNWGTRKAAFIGGSLLSLMSGISPYSEFGQYINQAGEAMVGGVGQSLAEHGLWGSGFLSGEISPDTPVLGWYLGGKSLADATSLASSMLQSAAGAGIAKATGSQAAQWLTTMMMGGAAASSDFRKKIEQGWDPQDALGHSLAVGIAEAAFEEISLDKLVNQDISKGFWKTFFEQGGIEMSEEVCTNLANRLSDAVIAKKSGNLTEVDARARELIAQGMTSSEAHKQAESEWIVELIQDGLGGFISGGLMTAGNYATTGAINKVRSKINELQYNRQSSQRAGQSIQSSSETQALQDYAKANGIKYDEKSVTATQERITNQTEAAKASEDMTVQEMNDSKTAQESNTNKDGKQSRKETRTLGELKNQVTNKISQTIRKEGIESAAKVRDQMVEKYGEGILPSVYQAISTIAAQKASTLASTDAIRTARNEAAKSIENEDVRQAVVDGYDQVAVYRAAQTNDADELGRYIQQTRHTGEGTMTMEATVKAEDGSERQVAITGMSEDGKSVVLSDGVKIAVKDLQADADTMDVVQQLSRLELGRNKDKVFQAFRQSGLTGSEGYRFIMDYATAYNQGRTGSLTLEEATKRSSLDARTVMDAYELGQKETYADTQKAVDKVKAMPVKEGATGHKANIDVSRIEGKTMNQSEQEQFDFANKVFAAAGVDVVWFASDEKGGRFVGKNGAYENGKIWMDIHAGRNFLSDLSSGIMATTGHELTHFLQQYAPEHYQALKQFLFRQIVKNSKNGEMTLERLIWEKQKRSGTKLSRKAAEDEVVADACQKMLRDSKAIHEFARQNEEAAKGIARWLDKWFTKIRDIFGRSAQFSEEAEFMDSLEKDVRKAFGELWDAAMREAVETHNRVGNFESSTSVQHSFRNTSTGTLGEQNSDHDSVQSPVQQEISSWKTSIKQIPALFTDKRVKFGGVNVDIGGGRFDLATNYLQDQGTRNLVFDPYNRSKETNSATLKYLQDGNRADTATCANVLNVIAEPAARANVILETAKAIKPDGTAYFMVYEGDGSGVGKKTSSGWQNNRKTADYVSEIEQYFDTVERKGKLIIATDPVAKLPKASWEVQPGEAVQYSDRDTEYLELAKDPEKNAARLQEMVDYAAWKAGYTNRAYHGTSAEFTAFSKEKIGSAFSKDKDGFFFTTDQNGAKYYASASAWAVRNGKAKVMNVVLKTRNPLIVESRIVSPVKYFDTHTEALIQKAKKGKRGKPYDSIIVTNDATSEYKFGNPDTERLYVVFEPEQIKSADPVTYDDSGNVIPLSERFNTENQDIRYSEREDQGLRDRVSELEDQLEMAEVNGLSQAEIRKLNNELIKARGQLDAYTANQRRQAKRTSFNEILRNLENYERVDLESLAEQISDSAWDDYDELSDEELIDALRETINERLDDFAPGDADNPKYGLFVKKPKTAGNISVVRNSDRDTEYLELAKDPEKNKARLQEMVFWAAIENRYIPVERYHQTDAKNTFTKFSTANPAAGKYDSETPNGIFLKTNDHFIPLGLTDTAQNTKQMPLFIAAENILRFADRTEANRWYCRNIKGYEALQDEMNEKLKNPQKRLDDLQNEWFKAAENDDLDAMDAIEKREDEVGEEADAIEKEYRAKQKKLLDDYFLTGKSAYDAIELKYDGHRYADGKREDVHTFIVFNPSQVKSADPVTYDDAGNVIPLSERFNTENQDIRYSERDNAKPRSAQAQRDAGYKLSESKFYSLYSAHKLNMTGRGNVQEQITSIMADGFKGDGGFGNNVMPTNISYDVDENGKRIPRGLSAQKYAPKKGEYILLVPKEGVEVKGGRYNFTERVKPGYKPAFDYEIVQADYDGQPYYEMYERAYDKSQAEKADVTLQKHGIEIDADSGAAVQFSIRTAPQTEEEINEAVQRLIDSGLGFTRKETEEWVRSLQTVSSVILQNMMELDYVNDPRYTWLKKNSDYTQGSIDFNTNCPKRTQFTAIFDRLQQEFPDRVFTAQDYEAIRQKLIQQGVTVTCGPCFVEDRRQHTGEIAQGFIDQLKNGTLAQKFKNKVKDDSYVPSQYDLVTYEGLRKLYDTHRGLHDAFIAFNNARGMASARLVEGMAEYNNQIKKWSKRTITGKNNKGGLRIFSLSDADPRTMIDIIQITLDAAEKGLMIQGYTKKPWFARMIKDTGMRVLRSHIPKGNGVRNGQIWYDDVEGINRFDKNYKDENGVDVAESSINIGDNIIGINDDMIRVAMKTREIDQIIPFHSSLANMIRNKKKIGDWINYKNSQTDKVKATGKVADKQINIYKDVINAWAAKGTPIRNKVDFVNAFLQVCEDRGLTPRFDQFLDKVDGKYVYTEGYEKFLVDYKLFDRDTGRIIPQVAVQARFNDAYNRQVLEDYVKGVSEIVPAKEEDYQAVRGMFENGRQYSERDYADVEQLSPSEIVARNAVEKDRVQEVRDRAANSTEWQGRPILAYEGAGGIHALTGSHRLAVARLAGYDVNAVVIREKELADLERYLQDETYWDLDDFLEKMDEADQAEILRDAVANGYNSLAEASLLMEDEVESNDARYSERSYDTPSDMELLMQAKAEDATSENMRQLLTEYQQRGRDVEKMEKKLAKLKDERDAWKEKSKHGGVYAKGLIDSKNRDIAKLEKQISKYRDIMAGKANSPELNKLLKAERTRASKEASSHMEEVYARKEDRRKQTQLRNRIRNLSDEMKRRMTNPSERAYVPAALYGSMTKLADVLDDVLSPATGTKAEARYRAVMDAIHGLSREYEGIEKIDDYTYSSEFDEEIKDQIGELERILENNRSWANELTGDPLTVRDLGTKELQQVYDIMRQINQTMSNAAKIMSGISFRNTYDAMQSLVDQQNAITPLNETEKHEKKKRSRLMHKLSTMRAVEMMSGWNRSSALYQMMQAVERGVADADFWVMQYDKAMQELKTGKNELEYRRAVSKKLDYNVQDARGNKVLMTKMQAIQILMTAEREAHNDKLVHLQQGGAVIRDRNAGTSHTIKITPELVQNIRDSMTAWDKAYMKTVRDYFSKEGKRTNEVLYKLKHRVLQTEEFYVPYNVDKNYLETNLNEQQAMSMWVKTPGSTNALQQKAKQPVYIDGMDTVMGRHVRETANYIGLALPIRDFAKVYNGMLKQGDGENPLPVKETIHNNYGDEGQHLLTQAIIDVQGGRKPNEHKTQLGKVMDKLQSAFYRKSLLINAGVTIKQAASYVAAESILSHRAIVAGNRPVFVSADKSHSPSLIAHLFMTPSGNTAQRIFNEIDEHTSLHWQRRQGMSMQEIAQVTNSNGPIKNRLGLMGAGLEQIKGGHTVRKIVESIDPMNWIQRMDVATTAALWVACKEQAKLDGMKEGSAEFWQHTTELYERCIRETQPMYDTLHRSEDQKDRSGLMQYLFPFRTVPIQNHGQLAAAFEAFKAARESGDKARIEEAGRFFRKTVTSQVMSAAVFAAFTLLANALKRKTRKYRDDDEELTLESLGIGLGRDTVGTLFSVFFPMYGSAIWDTVNTGIDYARTGKEAFSYDAFSIGVADMLNNVWQTGSDLGKDVTDLIAGRDVDTDKMIKHIGKLITSGLECAGWPVSTVKTYWNGIKGNLEDLAEGRLPALNDESWERSASLNAERYFKAWEAGDTQKVDAVGKEMLRNYTEAGKSEEEAAQALKTKLTSTAKDAFENGTLEEQDAIDFLTETGFYSADEAWKKVMEWDNRAEHEGEEDYSYSQYEDFFDSLDAGLSLDEAGKEYTEHGFTQKQLVSAAVSHVKDLYQGGEIDEEKAIELLQAYKEGMDEDKAWFKVREWDAKAEHAEDEDYSYRQYENIDAAIDANKDISGLVKELTDHGVAEKDVASHVKSYLIDRYAKGNVTEAAFKNQLSRYLGIVAKDDVDKIMRDANCKRQFGVSYTGLDEEYRAGKVSKADIRNAMIKYGGMTGADADKKIRWYDLQKSHPDLDITEANANNWYDGTTKSQENGHQSAKAAGMSIEAYIKAKATLSKVSDTNGNGTGEDEYIAALSKMTGLTARQKDALYYEKYKGTTKYSRKTW